jgi:hypothetical protein
MYLPTRTINSSQRLALNFVQPEFFRKMDQKGNAANWREKSFINCGRSQGISLAFETEQPSIKFISIRRCLFVLTWSLCFRYIFDKLLIYAWGAAVAQR